MAKKEILFNSKLGEYTLQKSVDGVVSDKKIPIKFKEKDSTAKYRRNMLESELLKD